MPEPGCSGGGWRLGRIACFCRAGSVGPSQWRPRASFPSAGHAFFPARLSFSTAMTGRSAGRCLHHCVRPQPSPYLYVRSVRSRVPPSHMSKGTAVRPPLFVSTVSTRGGKPPFFPLCRLTLHFLRARQNLNARPRLPGKPDFKRNFLWLSFVFSWLQVVFICI